MPVYLFPFHAYRSWNADNPRGFVQQGRPGIQQPSEGLANFYDAQAVDERVRFGTAEQRVLLWISHDACQRRGWRLHFVATDKSHIHVLVSWKDFQPWRKVRARLKNVISWAFSKKIGPEGKRWLSRGASRKRVRCRKHFDHLMQTYLPRHRGLKWKEGDSVPEESAAARG